MIIWLFITICHTLLDICRVASCLHRHIIDYFYFSHYYLIYGQASKGYQRHFSTKARRHAVARWYFSLQMIFWANSLPLFNDIEYHFAQSFQHIGGLFLYYLRHQNMAGWAFSTASHYSMWKFYFRNIFTFDGDLFIYFHIIFDLRCGLDAFDIFDIIFAIAIMQQCFDTL